MHVHIRVRGLSYKGVLICILHRNVLVLLKFGQCSPELKGTGSSWATESEVWIGNLNVKARKSTKHKLHKIWCSLTFCVISGKQTHLWDMLRGGSCSGVRCVTGVKVYPHWASAANAGLWWRLGIDPPSHSQASQCIPMEAATLVAMLALPLMLGVG